MTGLTGSEKVETPRPTMRSYAPATQAVHADDELSQYPDVAPAMHTSTTFRYTDDPEALHPTGDEEVRFVHDVFRRTWLTSFRFFKTARMPQKPISTPDCPTQILQDSKLLYPLYSMVEL